MPGREARLAREAMLAIEASGRTALIYLHSSAERQRTLAEAVGQAARRALQNCQEPETTSGTHVAHGEQDHP